MNMKRFLKDDGLVRIGKCLGKSFSRRSLHRLAKVVAGIVNNLLPKSVLRRTFINNFDIVTKGQLNEKALNQLSKAAVRHLWRMHADYYYLFQHPEEGLSMFDFSPNVLEMIEDIKVRKIPTVICGPHLGNFDLFGISLAWQDVPMMVLSVPNPKGAYSAQNEMRRETGLNVRPIDMQAVRDAKKFLLQGNGVVTGIDRPVENRDTTRYKPLFFDKPAPLPVFYTRYGLEEGVMVRVGACLYKEDGRYHVVCSDPIPMQKHENLKEEFEQNTEAVLKVAEELISKNLAQWMMLHPVWDIE